MRTIMIAGHALICSLGLGVGLAALPAEAAQNRCGWVQNPTPGNYWLDDRDGSWTILTQGSDVEPTGIETLPDFSAGDFVKTNGNYGYACACMSVETDRAGMRITGIRSVKQLPLAKCSNDRSLPKPEG
ncbi:DUF4087 domain-containing protein [Rhizobium sp. SSA_523]|uniref:DUF4087 domain-containing protein n=1 Tax=Rhizobium sp. SSA_523 TaxID=2952477 RepID=UPI002090C409|nr:DUF4087 domain-containing protein [Rhizobium sp. SSA_523]MCO5730237.1 DUF4087 domain-containing protein [Rhizobium sp. SSA_523]WKC25294.1 DUF4087 domain-containing protein [Rhizobium sp. SSA_523]